jgi:hypothetical protein
MQASWGRETNDAELARLLGPLQRRLWWRRGARLVLRTLCLVLAALLAAAALALFGLAPLPDVRAGLLAAALVLAALVGGLLRPPSLLATARAVDRRAGLADRLGTAVELAEARTPGPTAVVQIADATARLRGLPATAAVPLGETRHDAVLAAGLGLLAAGMLLLVGIGDGLGGLLPFGPGHDATAGTAGTTREEAHTAAPARSEIDARLAPLLEQLDALRSNEAGLTPEEVAARRAAAAQQLADMAATSRAQQEALAELARSLQSTAAGREVAENLLQGDYQRAAEALAALGRDSDQLSLAGRRQLADALRQAQNAVRPLSPELAERVQRAAQALTSRDYRRTERALEDLADAVTQAGRGVVPQGDLGMLGEALGDQGADLEAALAALGALGLGGAMPGDGQMPGPPGAGPPGTLPGSGATAQAPRLGAPGAPLSLDSLPSLDGAPGSDAPDPDRPSVLAPISIGATGSGAAAPSSAPLSAAGETGSVPTERREVVRGYFGAGGNR